MYTKTLRNRKGGFVGLVLTLIVVLLLLSAFKVNIKGYLDASPEQALNSNVVLIIQTGKIIWTDYIRGPLVTVWQGYVMPFVKGDFLSSLRTKVEQRAELSPK